MLKNKCRMNSEWKWTEKKAPQGSGRQRLLAQPNRTGRTIVQPVTRILSIRADVSTHKYAHTYLYAQMSHSNTCADARIHAQIPAHKHVKTPTYTTSTQTALKWLRERNFCCALRSDLQNCKRGVHVMGD